MIRSVRNWSRSTGRFTTERSSSALASRSTSWPVSAASSAASWCRSPSSTSPTIPKSISPIRPSGFDEQVARMGIGVEEAVLEDHADRDPSGLRRQGPAVHPSPVEAVEVVDLDSDDAFQGQHPGGRRLPVHLRDVDVGVVGEVGRRSAPRSVPRSGSRARGGATPRTRRPARAGCSSRRPVHRRLAWLARFCRMSRSVSMRAWMSGRRTLTTTWLPSCRVARWACPMDAQASGTPSKVAKMSSGGAPSSCSIRVRTVGSGIAGAASCSRASSCR